MAERPDLLVCVRGRVCVLRDWLMSRAASRQSSRDERWVFAELRPPSRKTYLLEHVQTIYAPAPCITPYVRLEPLSEDEQPTGRRGAARIYVPGHRVGAGEVGATCGSLHSYLAQRSGRQQSCDYCPHTWSLRVCLTAGLGQENSETSNKDAIMYGPWPRGREST